MGIMIFMLKSQRRAFRWPNNLRARLYMQLICQKYYFFQICDPLPRGPRGNILPQNF